MRVEVLDFVAGAKEARGITVIIDVFRAFSVVCYAFGQGAEEIIPVGTIEEALDWRNKDPDVLLTGERHGRKVDGFDFGNSPSEIVEADLKGRVLVHTTHAGTQGIVNAVNADGILTGSLVNAAATASWIRKKNPEVVTLVRMGFEAERRTDEDDICAAYLKALLLDEPFDASAVPSILRASPCSARFFDPAQTWSPPGDFELCVQLDRFPFPVSAKRNTERGVLTLSPDFHQGQ